MSADLRYFVSPTEHLQTPSDTVAKTRVHKNLPRRTLWVGGTYLGAAAAVTLTAYLLSDRGSVVWLSAAAVMIVLALEYEMLPSYLRAGSLRPAKHVLTGGGAALLVATIADVLGPTQVRAALCVVVAGASVAACSAGLTHVARRTRATLLVGDQKGVSDLIRQWGPRPEIDIRGVCLARTPGDTGVDQVLGRPVCGDLTKVRDVALALGVDAVVVAPGPVLSAYDVRRLSWALDGSPVELTVASEIHGGVPHRVTPQVLGRRLLFSVRPGTHPGSATLVKNVIDRVGAVALLTLFSPLFALVALLVRRDSPGPALFRQERVGLKGSRFEMVKFRTMGTDAEQRLGDLRDHNEGAGPLFKLTDDPRVTRIGRILRRTSLDELPQLVNVLKGEMSLIGPRPCLPAEAGTYDDWVRRRLEAKPGMTGLWQVSGRSNLSWQDSVRLDIDYVDNWRLLDDFAIAGKTARAVLARDGAS